MKQHTVSPPSDEAIIALYWQRNESAITETDRKYRPYLHTIAWNILAVDEDCEECLSDTYLRTWNAIPPTRPQSLRAFLAKITRRLAIDRRRTRSRERRVPSSRHDPLDELAESLAASDSVEQAYESTVIAATINRFLRTLDDRDLDLFIGRYFESDTVPAIAERVGMSKSGVRKALERLRERLRRELEKEGIEL